MIEKKQERSIGRNTYSEERGITEGDTHKEILREFETRD